MVIEFINHASVLLHADGIGIMNDPWLFGSAFNNGWDLIAPTDFPPERFADVDYIWFSHEHPDHFAPPVLKSIDPERRKEITILFQTTKDRKVVEFCTALGFTVRELPDGKPVRLTDRVEVTCGTVPFFDSWILYRITDDDGMVRAILNINDCIVDGEGKAEEIRKVTGAVDVMLTQFSYAAWKGNVRDTELRRESARSKLAIVETQIAVFEPRWTIPFASYVYFSHEENRYNNDGINTPSDAVATIAAAGSTPVVLYPGDRWEVGAEWENTPALERYARDYDLSAKPYHTATPVPEEKLMESAAAYIARIYAKNSRAMIGMIARLPGLGFFKPLTILVRDLGAVYTFSFADGLRRSGGADAPHDVAMSAESLDYVFRFDWGYDTLTVNGRFEADMAGFGTMTKVFAIGPLNNTGRYVRPGLLLDVEIITAFLRALRSFMRKMKRHGV